jgi:hypothetical protein
MPNDTRPEDNVINFPTGGKLFSEAISSDFGDFVRESVSFYHRHPEIEAMILADQRAAALSSKHERARCENDQLLEGESFEWFADCDLAGCSLELGTGRPRMNPLVVFVMLMLRGRIGGPCARRARELLVESRSLEEALGPWTDSLPAPTTILENLNLLRDETVDLIHLLQLKEAKEEDLDNFDRIAIDSTAVKASSCWPTDSRTIRDLCGRFLSLESKLESFGWQRASSVKCESWLKELDRLHKAISMSGSGKSAADKRRGHYRDFFLIACKLITRLLQRYEQAEDWLESVEFTPLRRERAGAFVGLLAEDALDAAKTLHQSIERIEEGRLSKARERVLGVADRAAAIIAKGGREPIMGYKPQVARSASGLVTAILIDSGNPADSANLVPMVRETIRTTGVVPGQVSADDGYASGEGVDTTKGLGVEEVSISGAKGRKLLDQEWDLPSMQELRCWRSSVESLMFVLKHSYRFGQLRRTGLEAVSRELTEKVLAYNLDRLILLRKRNQKPQAPPKAA